MSRLKFDLLKGFLTFFVLTLSLNVNAVELINWDKTPIKISIHQGDERMVILEKNISVGLPSSLREKLRLQSSGGVLYFKNNAPFAETRLMLKDLETGEIILIDLTGEGPSKKKLETIKIVTGVNSESTANNENAQITGKPSTITNEQTLPIPVLLTRYAAQNYYAPLRAIEKVPGVNQVSMSLPRTLTKLIPRLPVTAMPQSIWRLKGYEVIAIKLTNQSNNQLNLDARLLQGQFYSATFQHNTLGPLGQPTDTTMLYIVTEGKAQNAFLPEPILVLNNDEKVKLNAAKGGNNGQN